MSQKSYQKKDVSMRCLLCGVVIKVKDFPFHEWETAYCCYECYLMDQTLPDVDDSPIDPAVKKEFESEDLSDDVYNEEFIDEESFDY